MSNALLNYRENKGLWLNAMVLKEEETVILFRVNAPGSIKQTADTLRLFEYGMQFLIRSFNDHGLKFEELEIPFECPEWLAAFKVIGDALEMKRRTIAIEEYTDCGRLFDFDIWSSSGRGLSRTELGYPERKCFICQESSVICRRESRHSIEEIQHYIVTKAKDAFE